MIAGSIALAAYVAFKAGSALWGTERPEEGLVGIGLAVASLVVMPIVARGKLRAAKAIGSTSLKAEAKET